jgi:hypothetical protein
MKTILFSQIWRAVNSGKCLSSELYEWTHHCTSPKSTSW